jgi:hypothetical protein
MTTALFMAEELSRMIPSARRTVLDWGAHMFPITARMQFRAILHEFLSETAS